MHNEKEEHVMKKLFAILLVLTLLLPVLPLHASAASSGYCGTNAYWSFSGDTLRIYGSGQMYDLGTYQPLYWQDHQSDIKKVIVEDGITYIGKRSFERCNNLTEVVLPDTLTKIGNSAFYRCGKLEKINFPSSLTTVGNYAFVGCALETLVIPETLTSIGEEAFASSYKLVSVTYKGTAGSIRIGTYKSCHKLETVIFEKGMTGGIGSDAFKECENLANIAIHEGVTGIGAYAFMSCKKIVDLELPETLKNLGDSAFRGTGVTSVTIPANVSYIGSDPFVFCSYLKNITMYSLAVEQITDRIGDAAPLEYVHIIGNVPQTEKTVFNTRGGNFIVYYDADTYGWEPPTWNGYLIEIWNSEIQPKTGTCGDDLTWTLDGDTLTISGTGPMYDYSSKEAPWYVYEGRITKLVIEEGPTSVGKYAFSQMSQLTSASISGTVKTIGSWGFWDSRKLRTVTMADGLQQIGNDAFRSCSSLASINMPDSVVNVGDSAFVSCTNLTEVRLSESLISLPYMLFSGCVSLSEVNIPQSVTKIERSAFFDCYRLKHITLPEGIRKLEYGVFSGSGLEEITIPSGVTTIAEHAFAECQSMQRVIFRGNAPEIAWSAFYKTETTCVYPANNATWTEEVFQDYSGTLTWIPDGQSAYALEWVSASTTLGGNIGLNFYVILNDALLAEESTFMRFVYDGRTLDMPLRDAVAVTVDGKVQYRFTCPLNAKNMADTVTASVMTDQGIVGDAKELAVMTYCNYMIQNSEDTELVSLMKAMLNYGAAAQVLFNHNTDNLANASLSEADKGLADVDATAYAHSVTGSEEGIQVYNATLLLETETTIRIYFKLTGSKTIDQYTFKVDGQAVTARANNDLYFVEIPNIAAQHLDEMHTVTVGGITVGYGGLSYVNQVIKNPDYATEEMFAAAKALFAYNKLAEAYFN